MGLGTGAGFSFPMRIPTSPDRSGETHSSPHVLGSQIPLLHEAGQDGRPVLRRHLNTLKPWRGGAMKGSAPGHARHKLHQGTRALRRWRPINRGKLCPWDSPANIQVMNKGPRNGKTRGPQQMLFKDGLQMANVRRCLASLVIRKVQAKATSRHCITLTGRLSSNRWMTNITCQ